MGFDRECAGTLYASTTVSDGDFNNVAEIRGQGYDYMMEHGWNDLYTTAKQKTTGLL